MLLNIGVTYEFQQNHVSAISSYKQSLEVARQIGYSELIVPIEEGIGAVLTAQGKYQEALDSFDRALESARRTDDKTRITELLWRKSEVQLARGDLSSSIQNATDAIKFADQLTLRNVRYMALTTLAKAYRTSKQDRSAVEALSKAIDGIEEMRGRVVGAEQANELFFEDKVAPYREMVDLLTSQKTSDAEAQALLYAERAKGRVLADVLRNGKVHIAPAMTEQEKAEESTLNRNIVTLNIQISSEKTKRVSDAAQLKNLNEQLRSARLKYEIFQDSVYASHPELQQRCFETGPPTLKSISLMVRDEKSAFLEYVITKERTYLFVLSKGPDGSGPVDLRVSTINVGEKALSQKATELRGLIAGRDPGFADYARELYDLLVKPAEDQLKGKETLCIIPDGPLWEVPFQALQVGNNRYLLQEFALYYAPSMSVLVEMSKKENGSLSNSGLLLAFGNPKLGKEVAANVKSVYRGDALGLCRKLKQRLEH